MQHFDLFYDRALVKPVYDKYTEPILVPSIICKIHLGPNSYHKLGPRGTYFIFEYDPMWGPCITHVDKSYVVNTRLVFH